MPLGQRFDADKAIEAILYVAERVKDPTIHRVSKLLYFADKKHLATYGCVIAGDDYVAMKHGPVPSGAYDLLKAVRGDGRRVECQEQAAEAFAVVDKYQVQPRRRANPDLLSDSVVECLDAAIGEYGSLPFKALTERSHDSAWKAADENDFMEIEDVARAADGGDRVVGYIRALRTGRL